MFKAIKEFFTGKPAVVETPVAEVPYKVETPVVSQVTEQASQAVVEAPVTSFNYEDIKPQPVVLTPASELKAKKVSAVKKAPAVKKPRAPKQPKVS